LPDFGFREVVAGGKATAPPGQVLEEGVLEIWMCFGLHQIHRELGHAFGPHLICSLRLTSKDVSRVFRGVASGTLVVILILPFHERGAHSTVG